MEALFNLISEKLSKFGLYLQGGLYSEMLFITGFTVLGNCKKYPFMMLIDLNICFQYVSHHLL